MPEELKVTAFKKGFPTPLGASRMEGGWNLALFCPKKAVSLLIAPLDNPQNIQKIALDPLINRTGDIWHIFLKLESPSFFYAYEVQEKDQSGIYLDPYARLLDTGTKFGENHWTEVSKGKRLFAIATEKNSFNWEGITSPQITLDEHIIYEMHV